MPSFICVCCWFCWGPLPCWEHAQVTNRRTPWMLITNVKDVSVDSLHWERPRIVIYLFIYLFFYEFVTITSRKVVLRSNKWLILPMVFSFSMCGSLRWARFSLSTYSVSWFLSSRLILLLLLMNCTCNVEFSSDLLKYSGVPLGPVKMVRSTVGAGEGGWGELRYSG